LLIESYLSKNKQKLFSTILEAILQLKKKELTRDEIYLRIYKKKFNAKNDIAFRNHLSDLSNLIEDILIENKLPKKYETNTQFQLQQKLDLYFELNLEKDYENILKKAKEYALQNSEFGFYARCLSQYILLIRKNIQLLKDTSIKLYEAIEEKLQFDLIQFDIDNGKTQANKGFAFYCDFQSGSLKNVEQEIVLEFEKNIQNAKTDIGKFWCMHGICYLTFQIEINTNHYFEAFVNQARSIFETNTNFKENLIIALQLTATKLSLIGKFENANEYFEEIFTLINNDNHPQLTVLYLNYTTNLIKLKKYNEALDKISFMEKNIKLNGIYNETHLAMRKIMCYTFLEKPVLLHKVILERDYAALSVTHRIYFRLSLCNAYLMEENYELADLEIKNLLRSKLMNEADTGHLPNAELMQYLIAQIYKNNNLKLTQEQIAKFRKLQSQLNNEKYPQLQHYTPYLWLVEKLKL
jgi:hypothetical protein